MQSLYVFEKIKITRNKLTIYVNNLSLFKQLSVLFLLLYDDNLTFVIL